MKHQSINFKKNKKKGFSIAEILIYITILVFMLTVVINILFTILKSQRSFSTSKSVESSALVSMERITREIREAQNVIQAQARSQCTQGFSCLRVLIPTETLELLNLN